MPETPILPNLTKYGVIWKLKNGHATTSSGSNMKRDSNGVPIDPPETSVNDFDEDKAGGLSLFHELYQWDGVSISYSASNDEGVKALKGFQVEAQPFIATWRRNPNDSVSIRDEETEETYVFTNLLPRYTAITYRITSDNPNGNKPWIYPNDFPEDFEDSNHPKQYGGVILFDENTPVDKTSRSSMVAGIDDGPNNNGVIRWQTSNGKTREAYSEYTYPLVFDQSEFAYIPRNSYEAVELSGRDKFKTRPLHPNVKDANGKAAPIYPMNSITKFVPDPRESVTVTYTVTLEIRDKDGKELKLENGTIKIKQVVSQDTGNYIEQMNELGTYCQFENPGGWSQDELSPNYNFDYPYTIVSTDRPKKRDDSEPLERGDIWYNPSTDTRLSFNTGDIPETIEVVKQGRGYKDEDDVLAIWQMPTDEDGKPERCFKLDKIEEVPSALMVDIKTEKRKIIDVTLAEGYSPSGWSDGDLARVTGGNNDAIIRINISESGTWSDKFIDKY